MDFSDTSTKQGLVQDCDFLVTSDSTSYPLANKAASANRYLDEAVSIILASDGRWQWDDTNNTSEPIALGDLVANQQAYGITSTIWSVGGAADAALTTSLLTLNRVELKDEAGNWILLLPFDQKDLTPPLNQIPTGTLSAGASLTGTTYSLTDLMKTPGTPIYYDKIGNSLYLYPKPSYSQADSLKLYFQRKSSYFASSDTTKRAGIAQHLHRFFSLGMAYDYAVAKMLNTNKITSLLNELNNYRAKIKEFYSIRKKDEQTRLIARNTPSL